jgi:uncharacterized protein YyaL (SSP411 family)/cytochrome c biogenesis protein CcdA
MTNAEEYTRERAEALFDIIEWEPYSPKTFEKALQEQKPIFLLISAPAWCYWCHVYESEDYLYHPDMYPYINANFIPIFVDSDKRPDLTKKYLEGGWPSTTILSPDGRRITGFSGPRDPQQLLKYFKELVAYIKEKTFSEATLDLHYEKTEAKVPTKEELKQFEGHTLTSMQTNFDTTYGGFVSGGQKFPTGFVYKWLLEKYDETGDIELLNFVQITFNNQYTDIEKLETRYHLYDPVEGGFHRYSTQYDWSVPHYEKMIKDQAKLLKAYAHLVHKTNNEEVNIAIEGTISFVTTKFLDNDGSFYSSQDAYLEEHYYGLTAEERAKIEQPYIDKTRIMDGNAMLTSTFLYLYNLEAKQEYKKLIENNLAFLQKNMISTEGAHYYFDEEKQKAFLTGQANANAWALLAFTEAADQLKNKDYQETAEQLADYSLDTLYDWDSGGFFNRNSDDVENYAPNERIDLSKPYEENAVFAYSMLRLYQITYNAEYLEAGVKTMGDLTGKSQGYDEMYYFFQALNLIRDNDLLSTYEKHKDKINALVEEKQKDFFLAELLKQEQEGTSIDDAPKFYDQFTNVNFLILVLLAFTAGLLSFLSPCTFPVVTAYFAHNFGTKKEELLKHTVLFFLGLALVFSLFGMGATALGTLLRDYRTIFTKVAGLIIISFGVLEFYGKGFSGFTIKYKNRKTPLSSFLFGGIFAVGWTACIGPILAAILLLSATIGTILKGTVLLFVYAVGLALPLILLTPWLKKCKSTTWWNVIESGYITLKSKTSKTHIPLVTAVTALLLVVIGILIFFDALTILNTYTLQLDWVQNIIINAEEVLTNMLTQ